ncbi:MAG: hypothetical protein J7577_13390 [Sphingobacteriaceae bacterium]|nr:hypothetical protein [Sphingobacteriaceae bacterium]
MDKIKIIGYSSDSVAEDILTRPPRPKTGNCCYCEIRLNETNYTREHVIPKRRGGKKVLPCCKECNYEKGGMMLSNYLRKLNKQLLRFKKGKYIHSVYKKLSTKIKNATKLQSQFKIKDNANYKNADRRD